MNLVIEEGRPSAEVAKDLGICKETLRSWVKASTGMSIGQADRQNREAQRAKELETEIKNLRKQVVEKEEIIEVLKKSAGILSKP